MKEIIKYGFILGIICFLASGVLSVVNALTSPKIKLQKEIKENLGLKEVIPEAIVFKPQVLDGKIIYYLAYDNAQRLNGFVVKSEGKGYSSNIEILAGLNLKLEITDIKILSHNETPGLGNRISETSFLGRFKDKTIDSLNQVQAITGATISSSAVINSIKNKISELKDQLLKEIKEIRYVR